ncbi:uncharacterized protein LOC121386464 [Gigantopelta aegis]|uniref:uncharacterized protein LOC121386464 n=1 Tax=Gigantopelta aegis TaxID=1735272 RepID=UPI001B8893D1|nr:uncharacterized protein LOC121386464 [Gigantopelta aegis]
MGSGIEGQKTELKCMVNGTVQSGIQWNGPLNNETVSCNNLQTICMTSGKFIDRYTGVIDSPEQNTLIIESFNSTTDAGTWSCSDGVGAPLSYCNKTIESKQAKTSIDCMEPGIEGQKTELKCLITGIVWSGIRWVAPLNQEAVQCNYPQTICKTSEKFTDRYTGVIDSPQQYTLIIESFDPNTDAGTWTCYDGRGVQQSYCNKTSGKPDSESERMSGLGTGAISGIVIAVVLAVAIPTGWIVYKRKKHAKGEDGQNAQTSQNKNEFDKPGFSNIPI